MRKTGDLRRAGSRRWRVTRRDFLKSSGAVLGALAAGPAVQSLSGCASRPPRFGLVTDSHYADTPPRGTRFYPESLSKMTECVELMNAEKVDFLIETGDFKDQGVPPVETETIENLRRIEAVFRQFNGPRFHALGNHDMDSLSKAQFLANTKNTGIAPGASYYAFDRKGLHCVVLDANFKSDGTAYDHSNFHWSDTVIPPAQLAWLAADLRQAQPPVLVFLHHLLDGDGEEFVNNAPDVRSVLEASGKVLAVFQGHRHTGGYALIRGIHYYTLKAMVEGSGAENSSYAIVEVDGQGNITVTGYRRAESRQMTVAAGEASPV